MLEVDGTTVIKGWVFPEGLDVPDHHWYQIDFGDRTVNDLDREGHVHLARQCGLQSLETEIVATGSDDGILYAAAETTATFDDGGTWSAVAGADAGSQQVRDPEHVWSVAGTRSVNRVVKRALGIRSAGGPTPTDADTRSTDDVTENAPEGVDSPPSEWDGDDELDW